MFKCPIVELVTSLLDVDGDVVSMVVVRTVVIVGVVIGFVSIGAVVVVFIVGSVWLSPPFWLEDVVNTTGTVTVVAKMRATTPPAITWDLFRFLPII